MVKSAEKLIGKRVVVVGGSSGIGFGAAHAFLDAGSIVTIISSNEGRVKDAVKRLSSPNVSGYVGNVRDEAEFVEVLKGLTPIDHLIFTAVDIIIRGKLEDLDLNEAKHLFGVKFWGSVIIGKAVKKFDLIKPGGSLTLTSGAAAFKPGKGAAIGGALNAGVITLTKGLAADLAEKKIRVNVVSPGMVRSELWDKLGKTTPDDIAEAYLYLAKADYATGTCVDIDGGYLL